MTVSITPEQIARIQRATSEEFAFRLVKVNDQAVVRVHSPKSGNEYSVRGAECDCRDFEKRCRDEAGQPNGLFCKHTIAANLWIQSQAAPAAPKPALTQAEKRDRDFPEA